VDPKFFDSFALNFHISDDLKSRKR
jgi:hypothetical protein